MSTPPPPVDLGSSPDVEAPRRLAAAHATTAVGEQIELHVGAGWPDALARAVVEGAGFDPPPPSSGTPPPTAEPPTARPAASGASGGRVVSTTRLRTLADVVGPGMALLVVGLNPSLYAADAGVGFARPGNRFWPAAAAAGLVTVDRDPWHALSHHGLGMTDLVKRATARAAELEPGEYRIGLARLDRLVAWLAPARVCVVGLAGWRAAVDRRATAGWQARGIGGRPVYLMPNPSGINASSTLDDLAGHLREAARSRPSGRG